MEVTLLDIIAALKAGERPDAAWLDKLVRRRSRETHDATRRIAKKRLLPYYLKVKAEDPQRWASWDVDEATERALVALLQAKPRRTASGVATITVITKPWPCSSNCVYCPNDVRMPKSYLHDEPACQRAERLFFDPYLQVTSRLRALTAMGHVTDKVELIVLGGTWSDYPEEYQTWFMRELFRALNEAGDAKPAPPATSAAASVGESDCVAAPAGATGPAATSEPEPDSASASAPDSADMGRTWDERVRFYERCGIACDPAALEQAAAPLQRAVNEGACTYNQAIERFCRRGAWRAAAQCQRASFADLEREQRANESAAHRVVGLVIETRPDLVDPASLLLMRRFGCTKIQMGIQSLDDSILRLNERHATVDLIAEAFRWLRLFGFKIHVHFMVNLPGSTPARDEADYLRLVTDERFCPDEVKLYPCCLVESARLMGLHARGEWTPYAEDALIGVLKSDVLASPPYLRISRMIRDISSTDIVAGNKKTNLRQMVEAELERAKAPVREIRHREIVSMHVDPAALTLECVDYRTSVGEERFLQWVTPDDRIAGFLRLLLPSAVAVQALGDALAAWPDAAACTALAPLRPGEAMIREVHVYGAATKLHEAGVGAQHLGLGRKLVEEACRQAAAAGFAAIKVISAVGTRGYYRGLKFTDSGLYQSRTLP